MTSLYALKPRFQTLLQPLTRSLAAAGATANQVTGAALLVSLLGGAAVLLRPAESWPLIVLAAVLFARMALNAIDGVLARNHGGATASGAYFNELDVVVSDAVLYLPLALVPAVPAAPVVVLVVLALIAEFAGVAAVQSGGERRFDGPMGKADRAAAIGVIALLLGLGLPAGPWLSIAFGAIAVLLGLTIFNRVRKSIEGAIR